MSSDIYPRYFSLRHERSLSDPFNPIFELQAARLKVLKARRDLHTSGPRPSRGLLNPAPHEHASLADDRANILSQRKKEAYKIIVNTFINAQRGHKKLIYYHLFVRVRQSIYFT